jgi:hypothetical protein
MTRLLRSQFVRWCAAALVVAVVIWAATESLAAIGAQRRVIAQLQGELRSEQLHGAAVIRTNHQLVADVEARDSTIVLFREEAERSASHAARLERDAGTIRANRGTKPPLGGTTASDSVTYYRDALSAADREAELLRAALEQRWAELTAHDSIDRVQREQIAMLRAAADSATAALVRVQPLLGRADGALEHAEPRCRLARVVPCPSRTFAFVAGGAAAVLAYNAIQQVHR